MLGIGCLEVYKNGPSMEDTIHMLSLTSVPPLSVLLLTNSAVDVSSLRTQHIYRTHSTCDTGIAISRVCLIMGEMILIIITYKTVWSAWNMSRHSCSPSFASILLYNGEC